MKKERLRPRKIMNEIARSPEYDNLLSSIQKLETELAELVQDRDKLLYHICPKLQTKYMLSIGKLEYAIFEWHCKILRARRKMVIIQAFLNREQSYNIAEIEKQLDTEYQEYTEKLLEKQKEIENARLKNSNYGEPLTAEESSELKKLYTQIVKKLHPDINPDTTEEQHGQFVDAVNAYKSANLSELRVIFLLLEKTSSAETVNSMEKLKIRKELLLNEKKYLINAIQDIKEIFPYNRKDLLLDKVKLQLEIDELSNQLTECQEQYKTQESRLEAMLKNE
jgi:hypothetical protein